MIFRIFSFSFAKKISLHGPLLLEAREREREGGWPSSVAKEDDEEEEEKL
jgi:hypothetical protein